MNIFFIYIKMYDVSLINSDYTKIKKYYAIRKTEPKDDTFTILIGNKNNLIDLDYIDNLDNLDDINLLLFHCLSSALQLDMDINEESMNRYISNCINTMDCPYDDVRRYITMQTIIFTYEFIQNNNIINDFSSFCEELNKYIIPMDGDYIYRVEEVYNEINAYIAFNIKLYSDFSLKIHHTEYGDFTIFWDNEYNCIIDK